MPRTKVIEKLKAIEQTIATIKRLKGRVPLDIHTQHEVWLCLASKPMDDDNRRRLEEFAEARGY